MCRLQGCVISDPSPPSPLLSPLLNFLTQIKYLLYLLHSCLILKFLTKSVLKLLRGGRDRQRPFNVNLVLQILTIPCCLLEGIAYDDLCSLIRAAGFFCGFFLLILKIKENTSDKLLYY